MRVEKEAENPCFLSTTGSVQKKACAETPIFIGFYDILSAYLALRWIDAIIKVQGEGNQELVFLMTSGKYKSRGYKKVSVVTTPNSSTGFVKAKSSAC